MSTLVVAPIFVALTAGLLSRFVDGRARRAVFLAGVTAHGGAAIALFTDVYAHGARAVHLGGWPAPMGIALMADVLAAVLVLLTALLGLAVALQMVRRTPEREMAAGVPALVCFLLAGVDAAFLTADLFHLYVAFEVMLLASFVLFVIGGDGERRAAAVRYLVPAVLSSLFLLAGVGLLYGLTGTLSMTDAADRLAALGPTPAVSVVAALLAIAFALKAAVFPLFAWLPASYPAAPTEVVALFSGLLTKVGVYALLRVFTLVLPGEGDWLQPVLLTLAAATMVVGVLGALAQWGMQRLLTYHVVSQVGYLLIGLGLGTAAALAATVFYLVHNSIAKTALLLGTGIVRQRRGTDRLRELGGLTRTDPWLAGLFLIAALGLAGIPPLSGFWAKLLVFRSTAAAGAWIVLAVAAAVGVCTLLSMAKIWTTAFWGEAPEALPAQRPRLSRALDLLPMALLVAAVLALGLLPAGPIDVAERAATGLLDSEGYRSALREALP